MRQSSKPRPSDAKLDAFERERNERRMPGYSRRKREREAELSKAVLERRLRFAAKQHLQRRRKPLKDHGHLTMKGLK